MRRKSSEQWLRWQKKRYATDAVFREKTKSRNNARNKALFEAFLVAYGRYCACCGEADARFLTVGHVAAIGNRAARPHKSTIIRDLKRRGWPAEARTECFNCNCGASRNGGTCPHRS